MKYSGALQVFQSGKQLKKWGKNGILLSDLGEINYNKRQFLNQFVAREPL